MGFYFVTRSMFRGATTAPGEIRVQLVRQIAVAMTTKIRSMLFMLITF